MKAFTFKHRLTTDRLPFNFFKPLLKPYLPLEEEILKENLQTPLIFIFGDKDWMGRICKPGP